jgi:putative DNA primase/helicase
MEKVKNAFSLAVKKADFFGKIKNGKPVYLCEGYATGATIREATESAVIVAFDAGNLRKMAEALAAKQPDAFILFCADDDPTGTGERKAIEAAQAVGGLVVMPKFGDDRPIGPPTSTT